jgi:high affinity Mn2+ porin
MRATPDGRGVTVKDLLVAALALIALTVETHAAEPPGAVSGAMAVKAVPAPAPAADDWSGYYVGAHLGYAAGSSNWSATPLGAPGSTLFGSLDLFDAYDLFKGTGSYFAGFQAGYNFMLPSRLLLGVEADTSFPNTIAGTSAFSSPSAGSASYAEQVELSGTLRGRIGYAPGHWLLYATGGFAWTYDQFTRTQISGAPAGGTVSAGGAETVFMVPRFGVAAGLGAEVAPTPNWAARFEYLFTDYAARGVNFAGGAQRFDSDLAMHAVRAGIDYRFGPSGSDSDFLTKGPSALELDWLALHGQTTFVTQYAPPFRSPYLGPHSLDPNQGREAGDVMYFIGARLWDGAEFWVDPEIIQGFGLSNNTGAAGYFNGASAKVGASVPYSRIQRYFIRQTINLGGETQKVDADQNQFAGSQTADRLVFTVGKYEVADIFDKNKYAGDPRKDFLNFALIDAGTFDFAADAWSYTYGATAEWYNGDWTFRSGIFDLSTVPGSTELDPQFGQFQWVGEIERRYTLWNHPGKVAVTGFLTRGRLGLYEDAIALAQATGGPADIAAVRQYRSRTGLAMNFEQEITSELGIFARAGFAQGDVETDAYADIDRTVAAGLSLGGESWGRPADTIGLAGIVDGASAVHEAFFNAGGLGLQSGDGQLPHPGLEKIVETFYRFPLFAWQVSLDYQFIINPSYNRDRGPVSVLGARLHAEF